MNLKTDLIQQAQQFGVFDELLAVAGHPQSQVDARMIGAAKETLPDGKKINVAYFEIACTNALGYVVATREGTPKPSARSDVSWSWIHAASIARDETARAAASTSTRCAPASPARPRSRPS